ASVVDVTSIGDVVLLSDQSRGTAGGESLSYPLEACSNGATGAFDFAATSSSGLRVQLYSDPSCDGLGDALLAGDVNGDGIWDAVFGGDTDGDGKPDTGPLAPGECACF